MPLHGHFHSPLSLRRHGHSFHQSWATYLSSDLNRCLPDNFFAEPNVHFNIEIDVAAFEEQGGSSPRQVNRLESEWTPSPPALAMPLSLLTPLVEMSSSAASQVPFWRAPSSW